ncbi:hypothetical protein SNEBB_011141 [Seison nebaliae]|nr:hypothetical protein SNEBB_011141 [Seison nebaliae]
MDNHKENRKPENRSNSEFWDRQSLIEQIDAVVKQNYFQKKAETAERRKCDPIDDIEDYESMTLDFGEKNETTTLPINKTNNKRYYFLGILLVVFSSMLLKWRIDVIRNRSLSDVKLINKMEQKISSKLLKGERVLMKNREWEALSQAFYNNKSTFFKRIPENSLLQIITLKFNDFISKGKQLSNSKIEEFKPIISSISLYLHQKTKRVLSFFFVVFIDKIIPNISSLSIYLFDETCSILVSLGDQLVENSSPTSVRIMRKIKDEIIPMIFNKILELFHWIYSLPFYSRFTIQTSFLVIFIYFTKRQIRRRRMWKRFSKYLIEQLEKYIANERIRSKSVILIKKLSKKLKIDPTNKEEVEVFNNVVLKISFKYRFKVRYCWDRIENGEKVWIWRFLESVAIEEFERKNVRPPRIIEVTRLDGGNMDKSGMDVQFKLQDVPYMQMKMGQTKNRRNASTNVVARLKEESEKLIENVSRQTSNQFEQKKDHRFLLIQPKMKNSAKNRQHSHPEYQLEENETLLHSLSSSKCVASRIMTLSRIGTNTLFGSGNIETIRHLINNKKLKINSVYFSIDRLTFHQTEQLEELFNGISVYDRILFQSSRIRRKDFDLFMKEEKIIRNNLSVLEKQRKMIHENRLKNLNIPIVPVIGYTNSGKTTIIQKLTNSQDLVGEDRLFATLRTKFIPLHLPPTYQQIYLIDTIGLLTDLPMKMFDVNPFQGTIQESLTSNLMLLIHDISHPDHEQQLRTVLEIFNKEHQIVNGKGKKEEMKPNIILVNNKFDKLSGISKEKKIKIVLKEKEIFEKYKWNLVESFWTDSLNGKCDDEFILKLHNIVMKTNKKVLALIFISPSSTAYQWLQKRNLFLFDSKILKQFQQMENIELIKSEKSELSTNVIELPLFLHKKLLHQFLSKFPSFKLVKTLT